MLKRLVLVLGNSNYEISEGRTSYGKGDHSVRTLLAMRLGKDVARPDIKDEAGENAQIDEKRVRREREKQGRERSGYRSESVREQKRLGTFFGVLMGKHERYRVHSVGKPVGDDRERDHHSHGRIDLKSKADSYPIEKTVSDDRR